MKRPEVHLQRIYNFYFFSNKRLSWHWPYLNLSFPCLPTTLLNIVTSCQKDDWLSQCDEFKKLNLYNRYQFVRSKHLCINCLTPGHFVQDCPKRSFYPVEGCTRKHSTFLHEKQSSPKPSSTDKENRPSDQGQATSPGATQAKNGYVKSESF